MPLSVAEFVHRWKIYSQSERPGAQSHFIDLCEVLGEPHPAASDSAGERYAFEKHIGTARGGKGYADVWLRDHFAWEYKRKNEDLKKAYQQLNDYREDLGNPPLLVVCDFNRFEIHTNFTNTAKRVYAFDLDDLNHNRVTAACPLPPITVLRALFGDYSVLRPDRTDAQVTQDAAKQFAKLAERLELEERNLGATRAEIAHFLMRILFCLFADSIGLLPDKVFRKLLQSEDRFQPRRFLRKLTLLFEAMSGEDGIFGEHTIKYFNGGLFDDAKIIQLDKADLGILFEVSKNYDWSHISPEIFGTLFERSLDPARRSLIGAHYTSAEDILLLIEPVLMRPLEQRWATVRQQVIEALTVERAEEAARNSRQARIRTDLKSEQILAAWIDELTAVRVLDPACGSGNFLYLSLRRMLDLWKEAKDFAAEQGISLVLPKMVSPSQLFGIETEFYAHELASVVVWIGYLQWKHEHAVHDDREPILQKLDNIEHADAILRYDAEGKPYEPEWPEADFIIGNPPFLGGKKLRRELTDQYVQSLFDLYQGSIAAESDLVVYWFEKSRKLLARNAKARVGLLATQQIRKGFNQRVLSKIAQSGSIFWAISNQPWFTEVNVDDPKKGCSKIIAQIRIAMIAFDSGLEETRYLDKVQVSRINPDLSTQTDVTEAEILSENRNLCFQGPTRVGKFDLKQDAARKMLEGAINPNGRPNSDVVRPYVRTTDLTDRPRRAYIIDFGTKMSESEAALYQLPFEYIKATVKPYREKARSGDATGVPWWRHQRPRPALRKALTRMPRFIATPRTSRHRFFAWLETSVVIDTRVYAVMRADDYFFGVLHSKIQETWALANCAWHGVGNDPSYIKETCFDTFPFPWPPGTEPGEEADSRVKAIAEAARELVRLRDAWLNPPGASEEDLKTRTLTKLYNDRPEWLANAHRVLDEAVFAAYGWPSDLPKQEILARLLALNHERAARG
ncbi:MAG TPA: DNA methyltransferase [Acidisarcina sp.]